MLVFYVFLMIRPPPSAQRTDTLFPYPTLFRSQALPPPAAADAVLLQRALARLPANTRGVLWLYHAEGYTHEEIAALLQRTPSFSKSQLARGTRRLRALLQRSEERRVGKECVSTCRSRWSPYH